MMLDAIDLKHVIRVTARIQGRKKRRLLPGARRGVCSREEVADETIEEEASGGGGFKVRVVGHHRCENDRNDGHELDKDIQRGSRGILQRVADGVTDHGRFMHVRALAEGGHLVGLDVLLSIVPCPSCVGCARGHHDAGCHGAGQQACKGLGPKDDTREDRGEDDQGAGGEHLLQGRVRCDHDALLRVRLDPGLPLPEPRDRVELPLDFDHHF
eukprot:224378_1